MAGKKKNVIETEIEGVKYAIDISHASKNKAVLVNGTSYPFTEMEDKKSRIGGILQEYSFNVAGHQAIYATRWGNADVALDGKSLMTGKDYISIENLPKWSIIFFVMELIWVIGGGALPCLCAFAALSVNYNIVMNPKHNTAVKVILSILCFVVESIVVMLVAGAVNQAVGR